MMARFNRAYWFTASIILIAVNIGLTVFYSSGLQLEATCQDSVASECSGLVLTDQATETFFSANLLLIGLFVLIWLIFYFASHLNNRSS